MTVQLKSLKVRGYKSFRELEFEPRPVNILIGSNGSGKSNFISAFRLLNRMIQPSGALQEFVAKSGGASRLLHDGLKMTQAIECEINLETESGENEYSFRLEHAAKDILVFTWEKFRFSRREFATPYDWTHLGGGHKEALLNERTDWVGQSVRSLLRKCVVHQFHDTSRLSAIRNKSKVKESRLLQEDGGNLAAFLYRLSRSKRDDELNAYRRIVDLARLVLPFFHEFVLEPEYDSVLLQWHERGSDVVFDASQASDGMLRVLALIALLAQPSNTLPSLLLLDEPELGLHPYGITLLSNLIKQISHRVQVIVATQSAALLDHFSPQDVVVVERRERESTLERKTEAQLTEWLQEYSLGEIWEKNLLGGGPLS